MSNDGIVMDPVERLKKDLPSAMTMAAFMGVSWYISVELNVRLFFTFRRRCGLYFWSCLLCSWGVFVQPLAAVLTNFGVWQNRVAAMIIIYLSWFIMVVPQSFVLYSRLHLVMTNWVHVRWVLYAISTVSVVFSIPTMVMGILGQTVLSQTLQQPYLVWDKLQLTVFFLQETALSLLYIVQTRRRLKDGNGLSQNRTETNRRVHQHLIYVNILVIFLDCSLLALSFANLFYIQSAYKPCVYGIKLRVEFSILNLLIDTVQRPLRPGSNHSRSWVKSKRVSKADAVRLASIGGQSNISVTKVGSQASHQSLPPKVYVQHVIPEPTP